jgi:hypothetical protein
MISDHSAEIRVRRYDGVAECDVVVFFRGHAMTLRCRNYDQAIEWARIECKAYKVADGFTVERHQPNQTNKLTVLRSHHSQPAPQLASSSQNRTRPARDDWLGPAHLLEGGAPGRRNLG